MKKLLVTLLFVTVVVATSLFAQIELTLVGGLNLGTVKYNDNTVDNDYDISTNPGLILGVETIGGPLIIGGVYIQRGASFKGNIEYLGTYTVTNTYNYLSGYLFYPIPIHEQLSVFGGCQLGTSLGGTSELKYSGGSNTQDLKAEDFAIDFGLMFGTDFMFNSTVGARASYYIGLSNVADGALSNQNFKNRGIGLCLLYKIWSISNINIWN